MYNFSFIEETYQKFIKEFELLIPEGIYLVDLELLHHFGLLQFQPTGEHRDPLLNRYFHVIESLEKITLINEEFIVWIIPDKSSEIPSTYTLIALNKGDEEPQLEAAIVASGVYNSSKLVLQILERFLKEIHDTEAALAKFRNTT